MEHVIHLKIKVSRMRLLRLSSLTINQTLVISHIFLVLILIIGMSLQRFNYEWNLHIKHASQRAEDVLLYHVKDISLLVAGRNYSNLMLPNHIESLYGHQNLLFLDIKGNSDRQSQLVHVRYLRKNKLVWREDISEQDIEEVKLLKERFENLQKQTPETDVDRKAKLDYIIKKSTIDYQEGLKSLQASKQFSGIGAKPAFLEDSYYFDAQRKQLHMSVPLRDHVNGQLWGVFDVSELASIQKELLSEVLLEAVIATLISLLLIMIVTRRLVAPIQRLSKHMSEDIESIQLEEIKEGQRSDEIGDLARTFVSLVTQIRSEVSDLKLKSNTDALTGLGSRHKYIYQSEPLLKQAITSGRNFAVLVCDIDNFKAFNDNFGHTEGDRIIQSVAKALLSCIQKGDKCYRIGGDEFVILMVGYVNDEHIVKANKIRQAVENLNVKKKGNAVHHVISISLGMSFLEASDFDITSITFSYLYNEMFNKADKQLYIAKNNGRNNVSSAKFIPRGSDLARL